MGTSVWNTALEALHQQLPTRQGLQGQFQDQAFRGPNTGIPESLSSLQAQQVIMKGLGQM